MNPIPQNIFEEIQKRLQKAEKEHSIEVLFAIESGSRAWWFESTDSDFDVRFIYKHTRNHYLSIENKRDVIEYPIVDEVDINGWDIRKALQLFQKWNPTFSEWIKSPIMYRENSDFRKDMRAIEKEYFSSKNYIFHYLHMAKWNFREYLKRDQVRVNKYFYVLRPVLACLWIEKYNIAPPMEFQRLYEDCEYISLELREKIDTLLLRKKSWDELAVEDKIQILNDFLEERIKIIEGKTLQYEVKHIPTELLDKIFRKYIDSWKI